MKKLGIVFGSLAIVMVAASLTIGILLHFNGGNSTKDVDRKTTTESSDKSLQKEKILNISGDFNIESQMKLESSVSEGMSLVKAKDGPGGFVRIYENKDEGIYVYTSTQSHEGISAYGDALSNAERTEIFVGSIGRAIVRDSIGDGVGHADTISETRINIKTDSGQLVEMHKLTMWVDVGGQKMKSVIVARSSRGFGIFHLYVLPFDEFNEATEDQYIGSLILREGKDE